MTPRDEFSAGWWSKAERRPSPNFDARASDAVIDMLVVHAISLPPGEFGGGDIEALFCNTLDCDKHPYYRDLRDLKVSAHFFIDRHGRALQFVSVLDRAWHAGRSRFGGRDECNARSLGIELEGDEKTRFTSAQSTSLIRLARCLIQEFPAITLARIVGHSDIASGRKTDPGPYFDWIAYRAALTPGNR